MTVFFRGGNSNKQFDCGEIRLGTGWQSVLPGVGTPSAHAISVQRTVLLTGNSFNLTFSGPIAQGYTVWATTNLASPLQSGMNIGSGTFGFDPVDFADTSALNLQSRFWPSDKSNG